MRFQRPNQIRYTVFLVLWAALSVLWVSAVVHAYQNNLPTFWNAKTFNFLLEWLFFAWICRNLRHRVLQEKMAADIRPGPPKPTFLWQGVLILLPVMLMAGFGFWAILRERNAVEQEARQRAEAILQPLTGEDGFGRQVAYRLTQFDGPKGGWFEYLHRELSSWPGRANHNGWPTNSQAARIEAQIMTNNLAILHSAFPEWPTGQVHLVNVVLNTNSEASGFPRPPTWLASLSASQYQAWTALETGSGAYQSSSNLVGLFKTFQQTQPPAPALLCTKFWRLRAGSASLPASNAIPQLLDFASLHDRDVSDSGVPLRTLALAEALRRARECGPTAQLWEALQSEVFSPSALTPILLDEAGRLTAGDAQLSESIAALRILLADQQAQSELAETVRQTGKFNGLNTNLWVNAMGQRWFCILRSNETTSTSWTATTTNLYFSVNGYCESIVARGYADAFKDANISLPDYFSLFLELAGEPVPLPAPWSKIGFGKRSGDLLAEEHFQMRQPAILSEADPQGGPRKETPFEAMPGHPQFTLQIRLTDRNLLYARQRQLQFIFGAMVAASALAALVGFIAAYRAFRRQQQLNDLKSNFVSSVSHELRAPIASVRLMAENLEGGKIPEQPRQQEYYQFIVQECRRLSSLIENVLDFSRIEQGRKQYEFEPTDLLQLTRTTVKLMEPYAQEKGVTLRLETELARELNVDGRALQQALVNLLDNAIKHSACGETVTVGMEQVPPNTAGARVRDPQHTEFRTKPGQVDTARFPAGARRSRRFTVQSPANPPSHPPAFAPARVCDPQHTDLPNQPGTQLPPNPATEALRLTEPRSGGGPAGSPSAPVFLIWVADHGPGIPAAEQERIFEQFYRLGSELRRETQGIGIGLCIVKHIMTAHGGRALVDNQPGRGSRFTLELPTEKTEIRNRESKNRS